MTSETLRGAEKLQDTLPIPIGVSVCERPCKDHLAREMMSRHVAWRMFDCLVSALVRVSHDPQPDGDTIPAC